MKGSTVRRLPIFVFCLFGFTGWAGVYPEPREVQAGGAPFVMDADVRIVLPEDAAPADAQLAHLLSAEFSSRQGIAVPEVRVAHVPHDHAAIVMGTYQSALVREYCAAHHINVSASNPGPEGYVLSVTPEAVVIAGSDDAGAFYGLQSLRQLIESDDHGAHIPGTRIRDWPYSTFRGVKLYLPGRDHIGYFKRFVRDYMALYKYNRLIIEMNAGMRFDRHPELNAGWVDFTTDMRYRRLVDPIGLWFHGVNASHYDDVDGGVLEKEEVADLVKWAQENHIEVIPELPSLSHSYYLLTRHHELAEIPEEQWPDTYCPSLPAVYKLLFDVYDEYIEVMKPKMIHIGHDEWRMPWGACPRCRGKDPRELYAQDVNRIHDYLTARHIATAMWCDHLLVNVRGVKLAKPWWDAPGYDYKIPGSLSPEQVKRLIPQDILMFNWLWHYTDDPKFPPITNEQRLSEWGFQQVFGNFEAWIPDFHERTQQSKIIGGVPSAWFAVNEFNFGKDMMADLTGCAGMLWTGRERSAAARTEVLSALMPEMRRNLSGEAAPSETEKSTAVDLSRWLNGAVHGAAPWEPRRTARGHLVFDLAAPSGEKQAVVVGVAGEGENSAPLASDSIAIGRDATSVLFLHALRGKGRSVTGDQNTFYSPDSADLVGWYEIEYEDGLVTTVPLRFGWNILDLKNEAGAVAYEADTVPVGGLNFYALEWINPRVGKAIASVRLHGSHGFRQSSGKLMPSNAIILAGVTVVEKRQRSTPQDVPFPPR